MKEYWVENSFGLYKLHYVKDLDTAINKVKEDYVNCGTVRVIERNYTIISENIFSVDTTYE